MLRAAGLFQFSTWVVAKTFLNTRLTGREAEKIGKSRGNALWVGRYRGRFDPDSLRYYVTTIAPESDCATFNVAEFTRCHLGELRESHAHLCTQFLYWPVPAGRSVRSD